ncbi:MAG TPA: hypothetical protein VHO25_14200 [Polyangiaceae bacterium]|nr:hypothetical protein [Polyangiaceae bacterium]
MSTPQRLACSLCGFVNTGALARARCLSCGGKLERVDAATRGRPAQRAFNPLWFAISLGIGLLLTAAVVFGVPQVIPALDFEGSAGMLVGVPTWFVAGWLVGLIAPAGSLTEAAIAILFVASPTAFILFKEQTVKTMPAVLYGVMALVGVLFAVIGTHLGERAQRSSRGSTSRK